MKKVLFLGVLSVLCVWGLWGILTSSASRLSDDYMSHCKGGVEYGFLPELDRCKELE